jgi:hypothetical protein
MKGKFLMILALGVGVAIFSSAVAAHHGNAAYDTDKRVTLKGTVTKWSWSNPHCILQLDVTDANNQMVHWLTETENPSSMIRQGWTDQVIKPGDQVTVTVLPVKNGNPVGRIMEIVLPNGVKLEGRGAGAENSKPEDSAK